MLGLVEEILGSWNRFVVCHWFVMAVCPDQGNEFPLEIARVLPNLKLKLLHHDPIHSHHSINHFVTFPAKLAY